MAESNGLSANASQASSSKKWRLSNGSLLLPDVIQ